jgi:hypothetical protein
MPPVTLSKQQFGATAAGKKSGASYEGYLGYIARHRAAKLAAPAADPLAQTSPTDINSIVGKYTSGYGPTLTDPQIQSNAQAQIDPIIAAITSKIQGTAKESGAQIAANSAALAKALGGIDYAAPYAGAQRDQAAVDAALQQSLNGGGVALAGDLKSRLGMIGDPTVGAAADSVGARGTAIGTNELASGSTNLGSLIASAAAAKSYGQKMPGIAQLSGLQDIAGVGRDATSKVGDATTQIMQLLPQIVQSLRSERDTKQSNKASLAAQLLETLMGQNVTKATASAGLYGDQQKIAASTMPMPDSSLSNSVHHLVDQYGNPILDAAGNEIPTGTQTKTGKKGLSATVLKQAGQDAENLFHGVTKTNAQGQSIVVSYSETYPEAIKTMMSRYPGLGRAGVLKLVNRWYPAGGKFPDGTPNGRPLKNSAKTNAAAAAGLGVPKLTGPLAGLSGGQ